MNDVVVFKDGEFSLEVEVNKEQETVWLTSKEISILFDKDVNTINEHIQNIFMEQELDQETSTGFSGKSTGGRKPKVYNLDVIISVGYRVKSKRGILFRKWATSVLKEYMVQGVVINQRRLEALNPTVEIQSSMLASALDVDSEGVYMVVKAYTDALELLDNYDHQCVSRPKGNKSVYVLSYKECRNLIDSMKFNDVSSVFGVEKEVGKLDGILKSIYQNIFGREVYPTLEEKAANLLYFLIKDHPFVDGCKRIGASIFLEFLYKNEVLFVNGKQLLSNSALVAITLMIAQSKPEEKEIMIDLVMNFLTIKN
ncbi:MAG: virulence RhuM family protein [Erysipelotrichaceae bacterium]|nr:virulence RhuM family protein [Erysipelotrichaceae bacterium]